MEAKSPAPKMTLNWGWPWAPSPLASTPRCWSFWGVPSYLVLCGTEDRTKDSCMPGKHFINWAVSLQQYVYFCWSNSLWNYLEFNAYFLNEQNSILFLQNRIQYCICLLNQMAYFFRQDDKQGLGMRLNSRVPCPWVQFPTTPPKGSKSIKCFIIGKIASGMLCSLLCWCHV